MHSNKCSVIYDVRHKTVRNSLEFNQCDCIETPFDVFPNLILIPNNLKQASGLNLKSPLKKTGNGRLSK